MGYDLRAKNKDVSGISIGAFSWPMFLKETGAGYIIGYGAGLNPATYVYQNGRKGSPVSNDGYIVTSSEAKMMAKCIFGFNSVQRFIHSELDKLPTEEVEKMKEANEKFSWKTYNLPIHKDHLDKLDKIAEFMQKSGGFSIH